MKKNSLYIFLAISLFTSSSVLAEDPVYRPAVNSPSSLEARVSLPEGFVYQKNEGGIWNTGTYTLSVTNRGTVAANNIQVLLRNFDTVHLPIMPTGSESVTERYSLQMISGAGRKMLTPTNSENITCESVVASTTVPESEVGLLCRVPILQAGQSLEYQIQARPTAAQDCGRGVLFYPLVRWSDSVEGATRYWYSSQSHIQSLDCSFPTVATISDTATAPFEMALEQQGAATRTPDGRYQYQYRLRIRNPGMSPIRKLVLKQFFEGTQGYTRDDETVDGMGNTLIFCDTLRRVPITASGIQSEFECGISELGAGETKTLYVTAYSPVEECSRVSTKVYAYQDVATFPFAPGSTVQDLRSPRAAQYQSLRLAFNVGSNCVVKEPPTTPIACESIASPTIRQCCIDHRSEVENATSGTQLQSSLEQIYQRCQDPALPREDQCRSIINAIPTLDEPGRALVCCVSCRDTVNSCNNACNITINRPGGTTSGTTTGVNPGDSPDLPGLGSCEVISNTSVVDGSNVGINGNRVSMRVVTRPPSASRLTGVQTMTLTQTGGQRYTLNASEVQSGTVSQNIVLASITPDQSLAEYSWTVYVPVVSSITTNTQQNGQFKVDAFNVAGDTLWSANCSSSPTVVHAEGSGCSLNKNILDESHSKDASIFMMALLLTQIAFLLRPRPERCSFSKK